MPIKLYLRLRHGAGARSVEEQPEEGASSPAAPKRSRKGKRGAVPEGGFRRDGDGLGPVDRCVTGRGIMPRIILRRLGVGLVLALGLSPWLLADAGSAKVAEPKTQQFTGKVVPLAPLLEKFGSKLDADAAPSWLALSCDDGKVYPLIKDDGSRLFYLDKRLLDRPMRLTARLHPQSQLLQVLAVHSIIKGELHEVYYWCDICSIRRGEKKTCDCCGRMMELREEPVKK